MKKIILLLSILSIVQFGNAQNISGIINSYAQVTAINVNVITLSSTAGFTIGDKVLIIKMKGATINQTNTPAYGDSISMKDAGLYLFSHITAINGNNVTLDTFCNIFDTVQHIQMVTVPIYPNPTINATLTCQAWNGTTGGVLAMETPGTLSFNADIDVSEKGFRGGALKGTNFNCGSVDYFSAFPGFNGQKGEGIAEYVLAQEGGAGKLINGGGGAYAGNAGAGGGANAGNGGQGGNQYSGCSPTNKNGIGGLAINHQLYTMFLGGGGGGPQADNNQTVFPGGNGGALVYIAADQINGNSHIINANGGSVPTCNDEGSSAGGAGGSVYMIVNTYNSNLTINANGGNGGSNLNTIFTTACHGPGGGGGGGLVWFSNGATPANVTPTVTGGLAGLVLNTSSSCYNTSYSASNGFVGLVKHNFIPNSAQNAFVDLGPDLPICIGQTLMLDAGLGFASYTWDDNSNGQTRQVNLPGTYSVTVLSPLGCIGVDTIVVYLDTSTKANFVFDVDLGCSSDTVVFTNTSVGASTYFWDFGDANFSSATDPTHIYGAQNVYNVTLIANGTNGCADTISKPVNLNHPIDALFTAAPDSLCLGDQIIISNVSQPSYILFQNDWNMGDGTTFNNNFPVFNHSYLNAGTFSIKLTITDTLGCVDSLIRDVFVEGTPYVSMTASPKEICVGETVYFIDSSAPYTVSTQYDYGDGNIVANVHNPKHTFEQPGNYNITYTGYYLICPNAVANENIIVNDYPTIDLGPDTAICPGRTNPIVLSNNLNNSQIMEWSDGSTGNSLTVTDFGLYWANVTNGACSSTDSIWVKRNCYLNIPNSFSPSGDGLNDYFMPRQLLSSGLQTFVMKIFNRWGEMIFQTDQLDGRGWDGKYGGKDQPVGVYVYYIEAQWENGFKNTFQGNVTLVR